jgi:hypothetical protein
MRNPFGWEGCPMKVHLGIEGLSSLYKIFNKKKALDFDFQDNTLRDFT